MYGINDPSALLRPFKDLKHFTEELYAMFAKPSPPGWQSQAPGSGSPVADIGDAPRRTSPGEPPAGMNSVRETRIDQARSKTILPEPAKRSSHDVSRRKSEGFSDDGSSRQGNSPVDQRFEIPSAPEIKRAGVLDGVSRLQPEGVEAAGRPETKNRSSGDASAQDASRSSVTTSASPDDFSTPKREDPPFQYNSDIGDFANQVGGGGGSSSVFMGKVVSGSGASYVVELYPGGPNSDPGDHVAVGIPMIDSDEQIPAGTWLSPIIQFGDTYACQPPVWMD